MFWGLIMEPKRRYTQTVKRPFHISMASLDLFSADDEPTQVMLYFEERNYLLCTLQKGHTLQCALDLNFETGNEVVFATNGNGNIHLSGYLQEEFDDLDEEDVEEEEEEDADVEKPINKRKKQIGIADEEELSPVKKTKLASLLHEEFDSNDEDDESFVVAAEDDEEDDDILEEEEDEDEDMEDQESDVSSLSEEEEKEVEKPKQQQVNGEKAKKKKKMQPEEQSKIIKPTKKAKSDKSPMKTEANQKIAKTPKSESTSQQRRTLEGGVIIQELKVGEGVSAKPGKVVQVYYEGRLKQNNKLFDQTTKGAGFKFRLGKQEVIKAWDIGVAGMKVGGRRRITCPPAMAYGQKGSPPAIPANSTLIFEVELKNVV